MKRITALFAVLLVITTTSFAKSPAITLKSDFVSRYMLRGLDVSMNPDHPVSVQPQATVLFGNLAFGSDLLLVGFSNYDIWQQKCNETDGTIEIDRKIGTFPIAIGWTYLGFHNQPGLPNSNETYGKVIVPIRFSPTLTCVKDTGVRHWWHAEGNISQAISLAKHPITSDITLTNGEYWGSHSWGIVQGRITSPFTYRKFTVDPAVVYQYGLSDLFKDTFWGRIGISYTF
jgi:hypothetical protein